MKASFVPKTLVASAAVKTTGTGVSIDVPAYARKAVILLEVTNSDNEAGDTLDAYVQLTPDSGSTWIDAVHFLQQAGDGAAKKEIAILDSTNPGADTVLVSSALAAGKVRAGLWGSSIRGRWAIANVGLEETNLCIDPRGKAATWWLPGGAVADVTHTPNTAITDNTAISSIASKLAFVSTGVERIIETAKVSVSVASKYFVGPYLKVENATGNALCVVEAVIYSALDVEVRTVSVALLGDDAAWGRAAVSVTTAGSGEEKVSLRYTFTGTAAETMDVFSTGMFIVKEDTLTAYFDGSFPNCAWSGTADASTSVYTPDNAEHTFSIKAFFA
jgi:hypothetical protein